MSKIIGRHRLPPGVVTSAPGGAAGRCPVRCGREFKAVNELTLPGAEPHWVEKDVITW